MYFWKVESLKKNIVDGSFTDKELIPYLVISIGLYALLIEVSGYLSYEYVNIDVNIWSYVMSGLNILIPVAGTIYTYKCNGGGNGENFASKYISIGFVVLIRFLVYSIPLWGLMIVYFAVMTFRSQEELPTTYVEVIVLSAWSALLYYRIAKHIGDTAKT